MQDLAAKLSPKRFPSMSPFMAAVVGYVLGQSFTEPEIAEITVSESEGLVYIRRAGAVGFDGIQSLDDLRQNWNRLMDAAQPARMNGPRRCASSMSKCLPYTERKSDR